MRKIIDLHTTYLASWWLLPILWTQLRVMMFYIYVICMRTCSLPDQHHAVSHWNRFSSFSQLYGQQMTIDFCLLCGRLSVLCGALTMIMLMMMLTMLGFGLDTINVLFMLQRKLLSCEDCVGMLRVLNVRMNGNSIVINVNGNCLEIDYGFESNAQVFKRSKKEI